MRNPSKKTMKHIASVLNSHCRFDSNKQILVPFESSPLSCIWYGFKPHSGKKMVGYILKDGYKYPCEKSIIRNGLMVEIKYPEQIVLFGSDDTFYNFTDKALCYEVCVDNINLNSYILDEELNLFCNELEAICNTARKNTFNMNNQFALAA